MFVSCYFEVYHCSPIFYLYERYAYSEKDKKKMNKIGRKRNKIIEKTCQIIFMIHFSKIFCQCKTFIITSQLASKWSMKYIQVKYIEQLPVHPYTIRSMVKPKLNQCVVLIVFIISDLQLKNFCNGSFEEV